MTNAARAHTNIALIKYWGKADSKLRLPLMSSLSMTLDAFYTDTKLSPTSGPMQFYLDGKRQNPAESKRVFNYVRLLQHKFNLTGNLIIRSVNHVPTAAGLASSSSAFAALAGSFCRFYHLQIGRRYLSRLARLGSGSATRSIFGGFVIWQKGRNDATSFAYPLVSEPKMDLHLLAIELDTNHKKRSSTNGMQDAQNSPFFLPWLKRNHQELKVMINAIKENNFTKVGQLAELNANEMHAVNLTAQPEFTYFEPETIKAIKLVEYLRQQGIECYYTLDAGPNLKILTQLRNVKEIKESFETIFNHVNIVVASFGKGIEYLD